MDGAHVFRFIIAALATWRLAHLLAKEEGPWDVFARLRAAASDAALGRTVSCVKCSSLWIAAPLAWFVGGTWLEMVVSWLALSGVAALVDEWTRPPFEWKESQDSTDDEMLRTNADRRDE